MASTDSSVAHSPLFRLSPELRNTIYRLVLVEDHDEYEIWPVEVDEFGVPEPALLLSNKVIRSEALGVFYYENHFSCTVRNFNPAPVLLLQSKFKMPFDEHPMFISIRSDRRDITRKTWKNLVAWIHMYHKGKCPSFFHGVDCHDQFGRDERAEMALVQGLFDVAEKCPKLSTQALDCVIMEDVWEMCAWLS